MNIVRNIFFAIVSLIALDAFSIGAEGKTNIEVKSDHLRIDHTSRTALFEGNVRANFQGMEMQCDTMTVLYNNDGTLSTLKAMGNVRISRSGDSASASSATLDTKRGTLLLKGSAKVRRGPHVLEGASISVNLTNWKIDVDDARGLFKIDLEKRN